MPEDADFPIIRFVDYVFEYAVKKGASNIHFEIFADGVLIRLRIDGVLTELPAPNRRLADAIISRVKILATFDLDEECLPQDGYI
jgi:type II secretory ATPase GspE/PulE/Tfp pilus assembly ATPase PilB-like protein